jgi:hypothetical protein
MLRRVNLWLLNVLLLVSLQGCGGCGEDDPAGPAIIPDRDGEVDEGDGGSFDSGPPPIDVPDASDLYPGDPPEELAGESCAADTNKIYELVTSSGNAQPAQLAVSTSARFGVAFVSSADVMCTTGVSFTELYGAPGVNVPSPMTAYDDCTLIEQASIARGDGLWLLAISDNRQDARDLWVHAFDAADGDTIGQHRITENMASEGPVKLLRIDNERALLVWGETAFDGTGTMLLGRFVSGTGEPMGEPIEIQGAGEGFYSSLSLALLGEFYIGLAYAHDDGAGARRIVLDVLSQETGERERDSWVLTTSPGENATVDLASGSLGAGVVYTLAEGTSRQIWFQGLGFDGRAAPVMSAGGLLGGPSEPTRIVENPQQGIDVSMTKLLRGFALSYRALPSVGVTVPQIRVHFLDRDGRIIGDSAVALAELSGGQTAIEVATDGRVVLSWTDTDEEGNSTLRALIVPCGS